MRSVRVTVNNKSNLNICLILERGGDVEGDGSDSVTLVTAYSIITANSRNCTGPVLAVVNRA